MTKMMTSLQRALYEIEFNNMCDSFSKLRVSSLPPKPVVVETILEKDALKQDGIVFHDSMWYESTMTEAEEYVYMQKAKDRMIKIERQQYIDEMEERGTPFCVCLPVSDDEKCIVVTIDSYNNDGNNESSSKVSVDNMDTVVQLQIEDDKTTTQCNDDEKADSNNQTTTEASDDCTASTATMVTDDETDDEKEDDDDDKVDVMEDVPDMSTSTAADDDEETGQEEERNGDILLKRIAKYMATATDNVTNDVKNDVTTTVNLTKDFATTTVNVATLIFKAAIIIPAATVTFLLFKIMKRVFNTIFKSKNEFDDEYYDGDDCSECSEALPPLEPPTTAEEMLEMMMEGREYESEDEFRKVWEFRFGTPVYSYEYFKFDIAEANRRREEEEEDMAWELENKPWWKFW